jgi:sn-glycerol 3-phosphate transport system permease protein
MKKPGQRPRARCWLAGRWMLFLAAVIALAEVLPYVWMVLSSFMTLNEASTGAFWPSAFQWSNYAQVIRSVPIGRYYLNTVVVTVGIAGLQVFFACLAAYAFARMRFPGRDLLFALVLVCLLIPPQVRFVPVFLMLNEVGLLNTYLALILPHSVSALGTFLIRQAFLAVPEDLIDAARVDGASTMQVIWRIMVPAARPTIVAFVLFSVVYHWNDYFWTLVMTSDETVRTLPLGVAMMREEGTGVRWHLLMAANVLMVMPLLAFFAAAQRNIVKAFQW